MRWIIFVGLVAGYCQLAVAASWSSSTKAVGVVAYDGDNGSYVISAAEVCDHTRHSHGIPYSGWSEIYWYKNGGQYVTLIAPLKNCQKALKIPANGFNSLTINVSGTRVEASCPNNVMQKDEYAGSGVDHGKIGNSKPTIGRLKYAKSSQHSTVTGYDTPCTVTLTNVATGETENFAQFAGLAANVASYSHSYNTK